MQFSNDPPTRRFKVLAQDPSVLGRDGFPLMTSVEIPGERLTRGPKGGRIHVVDYDSTADRMLAPRKTRLDVDIAVEHLPKAKNAAPSTKEKAYAALLADPHFHAQNVYALVASTLMEFERALGRRVGWGFPSGAHRIKIAPHAFADMNAFYSRQDEALAFGYFPADPRGKEIVFTCLSHDVVVHEATHAVLDGLRQEYMRPASVDQGAFHEGFADIVALLSAFKSKELIDLALGGRPGSRLAVAKNLEPEKLRDSVLVGLAEEFGKALAHETLTKVRGDALRRSAEMKPGRDYYNDPKKRAEVHDFGEVLVAPVINAFLEIWRRRVEPLISPDRKWVHRERAIEEGAKAARHLLGMCIRALDYMPPVNISYPDYLSALLTADVQAAPSDVRYGYRDALRESFAGYGMKPASSNADGYWDPPEDEAKIEYGRAGHAEMQWDREALFGFLWHNARVLELRDEAFTKIVSVRPVVRQGPDGFTLRETVVEYLQLLDLFAGELKALKLEAPEGMRATEPVRLQGGGTLIFNDYGRLKFHVGSGVASKRQTERLQSLWDRGAFDKERQAERRFSQLHRERAIGHAPRRKEQW